MYRGYPLSEANRDSTLEYFFTIGLMVVGECKACKTRVFSRRFNGECADCLKDQVKLSVLNSMFVGVFNHSKLASAGASYICQQLQQASFTRKIGLPIQASSAGKKP